jgi:hypothetical protein
MLKCFAFLALALLAACAAIQVTGRPLDEQRALDATLAGWRAAGLTDPGDCLRGTRVEWARDDADFLHRCSDALGVSDALGAALGISAKDDAGCVAYDQHNGFVTTYVPVALLRAGQPLLDSTGGPAVHEWMHALYRCTYGAHLQDMFNASHKDPRVWSDTGGKLSAQGRAATLLIEHSGAIGGPL